eukprot:6494929-Pyramimonas_sp.AAC.1
MIHTLGRPFEALGASWKYRGPPGGHLEVSRGAFGAFLNCIGGLSGRLKAVLGAVGAPQGLL